MRRIFALSLLALGACTFEPPFGENGLDGSSSTGLDARPRRDGEVDPDAAPFDGGVMVICGDGRIEGPETCDDRNSRGGDGCSASCIAEPGWTCGGDPYRCTNAAPRAAADQFTVVEDTPTLLEILANDVDTEGDILAVAAFDQPLRGMIVQLGSALLYTPNLDYNGSDSFTYTMRDSAGSTSTAAVSLSISPVNDAPRASNLEVRTAYDVAISIPLSARDPEGDTTSYFIARPPRHGTINGAFLYDPNVGFSGFDDFTYFARDPSSARSATATVTIGILPANWRREVDSWPVRRRITIAQVDQNLTDFHALLRLDSRYIDYSSMRADGRDLRFYGATGGAFDYEIELWDPNGDSIVWIAVPSVSSSTTTQFFMYYGNQNAPPGDDPGRTWGREMSGVYHLGPDLRESNGGSTASNNGTTDEAGLIGRARGFDGMSFIELATGLLDAGGGSASAWVKIPSTFNVSSKAIAIYGTDATNGTRDGFGSESEIHWGLDQQEQIEFFARGTANDVQFETDSSGMGPGRGYNDDQWHYIAVTWIDPGEATIYVDGESRASAQYGARNFVASAEMRLGGPVAQQSRWVGLIDEVRMTDVPLSAERIAAQYSAVTDPNFVTIGGEDDGLP